MLGGLPDGNDSVKWNNFVLQTILQVVRLYYYTLNAFRQTAVVNASIHISLILTTKQITISHNLMCFNDLSSI